MANILKFLNIDFTTQYSCVWSNNRIYDFYIPSLNMIIETHGEQHYKNKFKIKKRTLQEEQENDQLKYNLAIENGIKSENYIAIDCRKSEFDWLKNQFLLSFNNIFDIEEVNMKEIYRLSQSSIVEKSWELWNSGLFNDISELATELKFCRTTVYRWLCIGSELGCCNYTKNNRKINISGDVIISKRCNKKQVLQYTKDDIFIKEYISIRDAHRETGIAFQSIGKCANGKLPTAGGFIWKHRGEK